MNLHIVSKQRLLLRFTSLLLAPCILVACEVSPAREDVPPNPSKVNTRLPHLVSEHLTIRVSGALEADKTAPLSFLVPGKVENVLVDEGDHVASGQLLSHIETVDYQSNFEIADARLVQSQDAYDRLRPLYLEGAFPEKGFIEVETGLAQAKAHRRIAQKKLEDTRLVSPFPGIVGAKNVEIGQMAVPGFPVFTIIKTDTIYANVSVPESEIGKLAIGQRATVTIPALDGRKLVGKIARIGVVAAPRTRTYTVKIALKNRDYSLRTGMIADAEIATNKEVNLLTVPGKAIIRDADDLTYVFVAARNQGKAFRQRVFVGSLHRNEVEIRKGLNPQDEVVVSGQHRIADGAAITVTSSTDEQR